MSVWADFLAARRVLINEWRREGKSCTEIAATLSMDPGQVWLISEVEDKNSEPPKDAKAAIVRHTNAQLAALRGNES
ncbi:MAG TPA: hypothetical protein VM531_11250 [Sphingomicrobium sp.]|jgi:hypothetical protein|nr:hypothetical protein [Sphingomicrobium sp.]